MADQLLDPIRDFIDGGAIDFEGQRLAEQLNTNLLAIVGLVSLMIGYFAQNISYTLWSGLAGTVLVFLAIVPPWPFFNQNNVQWLPSQNALSSINVQLDSKSQ